jgi:multisubunit Na+/H+ antiporter MnhF subunit
VLVNLLSDFGPNPPTGVMDIDAVSTAMIVFIMLSAVLWGLVVYRRNKRESGGLS